MKILLPVDGSELSLKAVRLAVDLLRQGLSGTLVLANVQEPATLYEMVVAPDGEVLRRVATAAGVLLGIAPGPMLVALLAWLVFFFATKYVSLASIAAAVAVPATMTVQMLRAHRIDWVLLTFGIVLGVLVVVRHRTNIQRLIAGTENKTGAKKK